VDPHCTDGAASEHHRSGPERSALFWLGVLLLISAGGEVVRPGFDALGWGVDLRLLGPVARVALAAAAGTALLQLALARVPSASQVRAARLALRALLAAGALGALAQLAGGPHHETTRLAGRLPVLAGLIWTSRHLRTPGAAAALAGPFPTGRTLAHGLAMATVLAVLHIVGFRSTPEGQATGEAAVVFGARAYADGRASPPLAARMEAACRLHAGGRVRWLILSGGPADGRMHETVAMQRLARGCGVPDEHVLIDRQGTSTHRTVLASLQLARRQHISSLVAVSQGWHLARITLDYRRRGIAVASVAAADPRSAAAVTRQLLREVIAFWGYFLLRV
jgi:vancomycin permeability regulator SanA